MKQRESGLPFDDFRSLIASLPEGNEDIVEHTRQQMSVDLREKPNAIASLCEWYARWSGRSPVVHRPLLTLFAGTHAIADTLDGGAQSRWLLESVTQIAEGKAVVNRLCHQHGLGLKLFDLALQLPVSDISLEAALDEKSCAGTIAFGMEAIAGGSDLLSVCAIAQEVDYSALTILSVLHEIPVASLASDLVLDEERFARLQLAIDNASPHRENPLEVLRRLGGRETAAICGAILSARTEHVPVILGGASALAACAVLHAQNPDAVSHCVFASGFADTAYNQVLQAIALPTVFEKPLSPVFGADLIMASGVVQSACKHVSAEAQATSA
ncbi:MAG: nicotinate-nucleotide--dimethylbenzimidazole phosphoribosyltransferase [Pseudomonadota bacterium]